MTDVEALAAFASQATIDRLSDGAKQALKTHILDALGCAIGAADGAPPRMIRRRVDELGASGRATLVGGGRTTLDWATFYNSALVRYLDYNDSYLAPGETCHPSDNLAAVLAATEFAQGTGDDLLTSLALAYQVQCRLSDVAPVRARGFDHTVQLAYAIATGVSRALRLSPEQMANAIALAGTALNSLRVTRTGALSHWKGLAAPYTAFAATQLVLLAQSGITGPLEVFEGNKGFKDSIAGQFEIDWSTEDLDRVNHTIIKQYNAEIHSQSTLAVALALRSDYHLQPKAIERIDVETFDVAYNIIGGGEEGDKRHISTKEEADHSLPYLVAVALIDGGVEPAQFEAERIRRDDVQRLLRRVTVRPVDEFSRRFPERMMSRVTIQLTDGEVLTRLAEDYEGFTSRPMSWTSVTAKFNRLAEPYADAAVRERIIEVVGNLEAHSVGDLTDPLSQVLIRDECFAHL